VDQVEVLQAPHTTHDTRQNFWFHGEEQRRTWCEYEVRDLEVLEGVVDGLDRTLRLVVVVEHLARDEQLLTAVGNVGQIQHKLI
jgi:hypothetical protein